MAHPQPSLHHRREISDIRHAFDHNLAQRPHVRKGHAFAFPELSDDSDVESDSERSTPRSRSAGSHESYQTQPTQYSNESSRKLPLVHYITEEELSQRTFDDRIPQESPRSSVGTYASTVPSEEDLLEEPPAYDAPEYQVPAYTARSYEPEALAATPEDFSNFFPSRRRLDIRHDDSTIDGNMNLRIDTPVCYRGEERPLTLFHLRMHDLRNREFSLRRYCRDSGREVCHSSRPKQQKPALDKRPGFQRSLSNAFSSMRPKSDLKTPTLASLKRNDSGYGSMHSIDLDLDERPRSAGHGAAGKAPQPILNTIKLEFSNYAQVEVKRAGSKGSKRYEFEYWGAAYAWKRDVRKQGSTGAKHVCYHLVKVGGNGAILASIATKPLEAWEAQQEADKGGWIPACTMSLADASLLQRERRGDTKDLCDVVVATGLMALVDDCIRARFLAKSPSSKQLLSSMAKLHMEYVGPKAIFNEVFSRSEAGSTNSSRPPSSRRSTGGAHTVAMSRARPASSRKPSHDR